MSTAFRPLVISGPSGGGKSTVLKRAMQQYPDAFAFSVSHTTRKPRDGEVAGRDYHFVSRDEMQKMISDKQFLEHAEFGGNMYGTSTRAVQDIQSSGKICVLDVELQGVLNLKKSPLNGRYIFLRPPNMEILEQRLRDRQTESEDSLQKRLSRARTDMSLVDNEPGLFDITIINDTLDAAYAKFIEYIQDDLRHFGKASA